MDHAKDVELFFEGLYVFACAVDSPVWVQRVCRDDETNLCIQDVGDDATHYHLCVCVGYKCTYIACSTTQCKHWMMQHTLYSTLSCVVGSLKL